MHQQPTTLLQFLSLSRQIKMHQQLTTLLQILPLSHQLKMHQQPTTLLQFLPLSHQLKTIGIYQSVTPAADNTTAVSVTSDPFSSLSCLTVRYEIKFSCLGVHNSLDIVYGSTTFGDDCPGVYGKRLDRMEELMDKILDRLSECKCTHHSPPPLPQREKSRDNPPLPPRHLGLDGPPPLPPPLQPLRSHPPPAVTSRRVHISPALNGADSRRAQIHSTSPTHFSPVYSTLCQKVAIFSNQQEPAFICGRDA